MNNSVFVQLDFWGMVAVSVLMPCAIYAALLATRSVSRTTVLLLGFVMVAIAGFDVYFLQRMATVARETPSLMDDAVFVSEVSFALYLFPLMFGGIGVNLISHILVSHLVGAEKRFSKEHPEDRQL
ncbi:MAG: hypothetical protein EOP77_05930 [Variovorax sp.]|nr:MAG: hypothetical protein EOP77_05930 [Variovorax sp.]